MQLPAWYSAWGDNDTPTVIQLHWVPISYRIKLFELCCLVHANHYGRGPVHLTKTVQSIGGGRSSSRLRSSSTSSMYYSRPWLCTSSASGHSHMWVLPAGMLCPTTSAPWLILSSSGNCWNHTILVKLLIFVDFFVFSWCFSIWLTFVMHLWSRFS